MEKLAKKIAEVIGDSLGQDSEQKAVVAYGLAAILQFIVIFLASAVIGLLGGFFIESMIMLFAVGLLKRSVGGAHATTMLSCTVMSILNIAAVGAVAHYGFGRTVMLWPAAVLAILLYSVSFILVYKLAPVDSANKPIVKPEKIKRLRKTAFITLAVYTALSAAGIIAAFAGKSANLIGLAIAFAFAAGWQSFMLTLPGRRLIAAADNLFGGKVGNT